MSSNHKAPLAAFAVVAIACVVVLATNSMRSYARDAWHTFSAPVVNGLSLIHGEHAETKPVRTAASKPATPVVAHRLPAVPFSPVRATPHAVHLHVGVSIDNPPVVDVASVSDVLHPQAPPKPTHSKPVPPKISAPSAAHATVRSKPTGPARSAHVGWPLPTHPTGHATSSTGASRSARHTGAVKQNKPTKLSIAAKGKSTPPSSSRSVKSMATVKGIGAKSVHAASGPSSHGSSPGASGKLAHGGGSAGHGRH